eukprot:gene17119-biopygen17315
MPSKRGLPSSQAQTMSRPSLGPSTAATTPNATQGRPYFRNTGWGSPGQ